MVFLRHLARHLRGPVIALLDNYDAHKGEPLRELRDRHPRLRAEYVPSHALELNPDEGAGALAERQFASTLPSTIEALMEQVADSFGIPLRLPARPRPCILQSRLLLNLH